MPVTLTAPRPLPYPANPKTLGEHLRRRRHERGTFQKAVAKELRVNQWTYITWETDRAEPETRYWPRIIAFLGYDPNPAPQTLGERLRARYRALGLPRKRAAADYNALKDELLDDLDTIKKKAEDEMDDLARSITSRQGEFSNIVMRSEALRAAMLEHFDHLQASANHLLSFYRNENQKHRSAPPPARFAVS